MTEAQVATLLGKAEAVSVYPKFEHKSASEWAKILEQANAAAAGSLSSDAAPSLKSIKAQAELTHRFRDVWEYKPSKTRMVTLYFGEDGTLLNVESTFIRVSAEGGHGK
jgi:hypothetical protein